MPNVAGPQLSAARGTPCAALGASLPGTRHSGCWPVTRGDRGTVLPRGPLDTGGHKSGEVGWSGIFLM